MDEEKASSNVFKLEDFMKPVRKQSEKKRRGKEAAGSSGPKTSVKGIASSKDEGDHWVNFVVSSLRAPTSPATAIYFSTPSATSKDKERRPTEGTAVDMSHARNTTHTHTKHKHDT